MFFTRRAKFYVRNVEKTDLCGLVGHFHQIGDAVEGIDLGEVVAHLVVVVNLHIRRHSQPHIQHLDHFHRSRPQGLFVWIQEHKDEIDVVCKKEQNAIHIERILDTPVHEARSVDEVHIWKTTLLRHGHDGAEVLDQSFSESFNSLQLGKVTQRRLALERRRLLHARSHESEAATFHSRSRWENVLLQVPYRLK